MSRSNFSALLLAPVLAAGLFTTAASAADAPVPAKSADAQAAPLRFQQIEVKDDDRMVGGVAFTCLIPDGWKYDGGIVWRPDIIEPCCTDMRIWDPTSHAEVHVYPDIRFSWPVRQYFGAPRQGQWVLGARTEPPVDAQTAIRQWVMPERLTDLPADAKIVSIDDYPEYAKYAEIQMKALDQKDNPPQITAARALIEYTANGQAMQERVYCAVASGTVMGTTYWSPCFIAAIKAEKGKLDDTAAILTSIAHSVKLNTDWAIKVSLLRQYLIQQRTAAINNQTMQMDRFCNAQRARLTQDFQNNMAESRQRFDRNMAAMDQQTESMNKILTGVQNYTNPTTGRTMELPSNSRPVYFNSLNGSVQIGGTPPKDWTVLQPK